MTPHLSLSSENEPDAAKIVRDGLNAFNDGVVGYGDRTPLHVIVRDKEDGQVIGGMTGETSLGLLFIHLVYLPGHMRGMGVGTQMMAMAEAEAKRRGCRAGVLYTINFQAPGFYERLGWRVFGEIPCDPPGTSRVYLTKDYR